MLSKSKQHAEVAELADAQASGACGSNIVWVQVPSSALQCKADPFPDGSGFVFPVSDIPVSHKYIRNRHIRISGCQVIQIDQFVASLWGNLLHQCMAFYHSCVVSALGQQIVIVSSKLIKVAVAAADKIAFFMDG